MDNNNKNIVSESQKAVITNQFPQKNNSNAITSLVLGILSLLFCWIPIVSIITGIIGITVGVVSIVKKYDGKNLAIAGVIMSSVGLFLNIFFSAITIIAMIISK